MESFINFEGCLNDDWLANPAVSNFNDGMLYFVKRHISKEQYDIVITVLQGVTLMLLMSLIAG